MSSSGKFQDSECVRMSDLTREALLAQGLPEDRLPSLCVLHFENGNPCCQASCGLEAERWRCQREGIIHIPREILESYISDEECAWFPSSTILNAFSSSGDHSDDDGSGETFHFCPFHAMLLMAAEERQHQATLSGRVTGQVRTWLGNVWKIRTSDLVCKLTLGGASGLINLLVVRPYFAENYPELIAAAGAWGVNSAFSFILNKLAGFKVGCMGHHTNINMNTHADLIILHVMNSVLFPTKTNQDVQKDHHPQVTT